MNFEPLIFEAEVSLKLVPTDQLPVRAQDALEAGFEGPRLLRMAILDPTGTWEIDAALPGMLADFGCSTLSQQRAAVRLARFKARAVLNGTADAIRSVPYFSMLYYAGDYPDELHDIAFLEDDYMFFRSHMQ